eukprot:Blabericola_migrator_1__3740@NODE_211_length_11365_cov_144_425828_g181_i0_p3_GENE_NODE_211_length_11365_cov_144_425828_g181_i0NODE_211_length_11365_cov_144_425828_g181_i0_p3_ORF_typecomplete_len330_score61_57IL5/PF02025_15/1_9e03IL5/PF02025_15/0_17_NODE_211_length_11365_cov_144_425828_g181_i017402729
MRSAPSFVALPARFRRAALQGPMRGNGRRVFMTRPIQPRPTNLHDEIPQSRRICIPPPPPDSSSEFSSHHEGTYDESDSATVSVSSVESSGKTSSSSSSGISSTFSGRMEESDTSAQSQEAHSSAGASECAGPDSNHISLTSQSPRTGFSDIEEGIEEIKETQDIKEVKKEETDGESDNEEPQGMTKEETERGGESQEAKEVKKSETEGREGTQTEGGGDTYQSQQPERKKSYKEALLKDSQETIATLDSHWQEEQQSSSAIKQAPKNPNNLSKLLIHAEKLRRSLVQQTCNLYDDCDTERKAAEVLADVLQQLERIERMIFAQSTNQT